MALATIAGIGDLVPYRRLDFPRGSLYPTLDGAFAVANLEVPLTRRDEPRREGIVLRGEPAVVFVSFPRSVMLNVPSGPEVA